VVGGKVSYTDPDVERVRRSHLNDLENVVPWFMITHIWLTTGPSLWIAKILIPTFVFARIAHTYAYALFPQQPMRVIVFFIGYGIMLYEIFNSILYYSF
jgi:glutathione S-transferase